MREAVIVEAVRTPLGRRNGKLKDIHPVVLGSMVLKELVRRAGIEPGQVEDAAAFFAAHPIPQSSLQLQQTLERQRVNETFRTRATPELMATFSAGPELTVLAGPN